MKFKPQYHRPDKCNRPTDQPPDLACPIVSSKNFFPRPKLNLSIKKSSPPKKKKKNKNGRFWGGGVSGIFKSTFTNGGVLQWKKKYMCLYYSVNWDRNMKNILSWKGDLSMKIIKYNWRSDIHTVWKML